MASAPLNWLLKIGGDALTTTAQTLSAAINELKTAVSGKQDSLTFDNTPTENSNNPVTSDGVFDALATKANSSDLATVATTGSYNDLEDLPTNTGMATDGSNADSEVTFAGAFTVGSRGGTVGTNSTAEGYNTTASGQYSHAEGANTTASSIYTHAEGADTTASSQGAHAEGYNTTASGDYSHAENWRTVASGNYSHAEGAQTIANGLGAHAEGYALAFYGVECTQASGDGAHAEGLVEYTGTSMHSGAYGIKATGKGAHAEGYVVDSSTGSDRMIQATGKGAHAEGYAYGQSIIASGDGAHAEGGGTQATGSYSHAEGYNTQATGSYSHTEGYNTIASGSYSHAEGYGVRARKYSSFVHGYTNGSKFRNVGMSQGYCSFGFQTDPDQYTSDGTVSAYDEGVSGIIYDTATASITLARQAMYLLVCSSYTTATSALLGATVRLIIAAGADSGTPTNLSLGQTSTAPATISTVANNILTIKNGATARATQFTLIRVL